MKNSHHRRARRAFATPVAFAQSASQDDPAPAALTARPLRAPRLRSLRRTRRCAKRGGARREDPARTSIASSQHAEHDGEMRDLNRTVFAGQ